MMLSTSTFVKVAGAPIIEYDTYVPLTVTWPKYGRTLEPPAAVMMGNSRGYLEVKFSAPDGELLEIVVTSATAVNWSAVVDDLPVAGEPSVPVISMAPGIRNIEAPALRFDAYRNCLKITLCDQEERRTVGAKPVLFGIAEESLLVSLKIEWNSSERESFLASCRSADPS